MLAPTEDVEDPPRFGETLNCEASEDPQRLRGLLPQIVNQGRMNTRETWRRPGP